MMDATLPLLGDDEDLCSIELDSVGGGSSSGVYVIGELSRRDGGAEKYPLVLGMNHIGRFEENEICLGEENPTVSGKHALLEVTSSVCFVSDLGSTNRTRLIVDPQKRPRGFLLSQDGKEKYQITSGNILVVGDVELVFRLYDEPRKMVHSSSPSSSPAISSLYTKWTPIPSPIANRGGIVVSDVPSGTVPSPYREPPPPRIEGKTNTKDNDEENLSSMDHSSFAFAANHEDDEEEEEDEDYDDASQDCPPTQPYVAHTAAFPKPLRRVPSRDAIKQHQDDANVAFVADQSSTMGMGSPSLLLDDSIIRNSSAVSSSSSADGSFSTPTARILPPAGGDGGEEGVEGVDGVVDEGAFLRPHPPADDSKLEDDGSLPSTLLYEPDVGESLRKPPPDEDYMAPTLACDGGAHASHTGDGNAGSLPLPAAASSSSGRLERAHTPSAVHRLTTRGEERSREASIAPQEDGEEDVSTPSLLRAPQCSEEDSTTELESEDELVMMDDDQEDTSMNITRNESGEGDFVVNDDDDGSYDGGGDDDDGGGGGGGCDDDDGDDRDDIDDDIDDDVDDDVDDVAGGEEETRVEDDLCHASSHDANDIDDGKHIPSSSFPSSSTTMGSSSLGHVGESSDAEETPLRQLRKRRRKRASLETRDGSPSSSVKKHKRASGGHEEPQEALTAEFKALTVAKLRVALRSLGLSTKGRKAELVDRLVAASMDATKEDEDGEEEEREEKEEEEEKEDGDDTILMEEDDTILLENDETFLMEEPGDDHSHGPTHHILFTNIVPGKYEELIRRLGGVVASDVSMCTHLVCDRVVRTVKFLVSLNRGIPIVSEKWLQRCKKENRFVGVEKYILSDSAAERKWNFKLEESLERARRTPLLEGTTFFVTPSVRPPKEEMSKIIHAAGGTLSRRYANTCVVLSTHNASREYKRYYEQGSTIYSAELVLSGVLRQFVDYESFIIKHHYDYTDPEVASQSSQMVLRKKRRAR